MIGAMRHSSTRLIVILCACLFGAAFAQPAAAKSYSADRFDSVVRVLPDGSLDVTETVVFRFIDGTFKEVFREVPVRRTDGVEIVRAEIDGQTMPFGNELGTVSVRQTDGRMRVVWQFRPVEHVTRTFVLNYRVRGVVRHEGDADVLVWRTTPNEHGYRIESSTARFELPVQPQRAPGVTTRKTGSHHVSTDGNVVEITTERIAANGWVDAGFRFPARSVASVPPRWQQRAADIDASAPKWIAAAMLVFAAGLILLVAWRQAYDAPSPEPVSTGLDFQQPPDDLNPGLSGVLAANGRAALEHAMAAIFSLADRGVLAIEEEPRRMLGSRNFEITRRADAGPLLPHQERILEVMFRDRSGNSQKVSLMKARNRLTSRWTQVAKALPGGARRRRIPRRGPLGAAPPISTGRGRVHGHRRDRYRSGDSVHRAIRAVAAAHSRGTAGRGRGVIDRRRDDHRAVERGRTAGATMARLSEIPADGCGREEAGARRLARSRAALRGRPGTGQRLGEVPQDATTTGASMVPRAADLRQ